MKNIFRGLGTSMGENTDGGDLGRASTDHSFEEFYHLKVSHKTQTRMINEWWCKVEKSGFFMREISTYLHVNEKKVIKRKC